MPKVTAMTRQEVDQCPIRNVLTGVYGKWQPLILFSLKDGTLRFSAIKRASGDITQRVQTQNLRSLERDGYIIRTVDPGPPLAVSYQLTAMGRSLLDVMKPMMMWAGQNHGAVLGARESYDSRIA